jgi:hypothetical protein
MNPDDFPSEFRQPPRPEFAQSLYASLDQAARTAPLPGRHATAKRIALALVGGCLLVFALYLAAPAAARATLDEFIAKITFRGLTVKVYNEEFPTSIPASESYNEIWKALSPADISAGYPAFAPLPAWAPPGYNLQERAALYYQSPYAKTPSSAVFEWKNPAGRAIQLRVGNGSCPNGLFYDPDGPSHVMRSDCLISINISLPLKSEPQVLAVNAQPAILYSGLAGLADLSGPVKTWNPLRWKAIKDINSGSMLIWENQGWTFWITAESTAVSRRDLLRMAESIP